MDCILTTEHFDMLLFENYHGAYHHQYDLVLIARLLRNGGMKVGIVDIYQENESEDIDGIPVIHLQGIKQLDFSLVLNGKNKLIDLIRLFPFFYKRQCYYKKVINQLKNKTDSFYCGSYNMWMNTAFMGLKIPCFYWGLRSFRMNFSLSLLYKENPMAIRYPWIKWKFMKNDFQYLFVSNNIIYNEFLKLGIAAEKMIIREERCVANIGDNNMDKLSPKLRFLTIGGIRKDKQIEKSIKAFNSFNTVDADFYIVGNCQNKSYEKKITKLIKGDDRIVRINKYLRYQQFNEYFSEAHFIVFADKQKPSSVTNGTMLEALINHRPIIAPDYDPYSYYINKYKVGMLYDINNPNSLPNIMKEASAIGCKAFMENINNFLQSILFDKVSAELTNKIRRILNK